MGRRRVKPIAEIVCVSSAMRRAIITEERMMEDNAEDLKIGQW